MNAWILSWVAVVSTPIVAWVQGEELHDSKIHPSPQTAFHADDGQSHVLMPIEGPHYSLPGVPPPVEVPFVNNQSMSDSAYQAVLARSQARRAAHRTFLAPQPISFIGPE